MKNEHKPDPYVVSPPGRGWLIVVTGLIVAAVIGIWAYQRDRSAIESGLPPGTAGLPGENAPIGTSGGDVPEPAGESGASAAPTPAAAIRELATITGSIDGQELIGRRVDLHVPVHQIASDAAFWVGDGDNRLLIVTEPEDRGGSARETGEPPSHGISPVHEGQQATISGSVQRVPNAEEMAARWRLSEQEAAELSDRMLYIRADRVTTNGHGTQ